MSKTKIFLLILFLVGIGLFYFTGGDEYFTLDFLQGKLQEFRDSFEKSPFETAGIFAGIYFLSTALSVPGATLLTLLAGAIFGFGTGLILASLMSTSGSLLAFLLSRYIFRDFFKSRFRTQFQKIDHRFEADGAFYLATLRLIPLFPFFVINIVMGLTPVKAFTFFWVSLVGMLPGTALYVYAGQKFSEIESAGDILSGDIIVILILLGTFPLILKGVLSWWKAKEVYKNFNRPKSFDYDVVVIGAGAAGLVTSFIVAKAKGKVALIERDRMGGDCLNTGCVPSKALIKSAKIVHQRTKAKDFGLESIDVKFDFSQVMERVQSVIKEIEPHDSVERFEGLGVECILGEAKILDPWTIEVKGRKLITRNIVIATGARPSIPSIPGIKEMPFVVSETLWKIRELPKRLLVLGGGPIGVEMGQAFARLGSKVTIVEGGGRILSKEDAKVAQLIHETLVEEGITIETNLSVNCFEKRNNANILLGLQDEKEKRIEFDLLLVAVGRTPNTENLGVKELGVQFRKNGTIETNEYLQTNFPNIFACGDITGPYQLTHMASHQAASASINALSPKMFPVDYTAVPWCTYTDPEVATVGETEEGLKKKEIEYDLTEYEVSDLDRAITESEKKGLVRILTSKGKDEILGATIVHSQASSTIVEFVAAMQHKSGLNSIMKTIHVYPSFGEANREAASRWKLDKISPKLQNYLERYFTWRRGKK